MTKQEFKTAFKLITGKNIKYNTVINCENGIIEHIYEFFDSYALLIFVEGNILDFKNIYGKTMREISYEDILNMMKK